MAVYKAPVDDYMFILHELLNIQELTHLRGFENVSEDPAFDEDEGL